MLPFEDQISYSMKGKKGKEHPDDRDDVHRNVSFRAGVKEKLQVFFIGRCEAIEI